MSLITETVDNVKITVLVDDNSGFDSPYLGHHGLSLLLDITKGKISKKILLDTGQSHEALLYNAKLLDINLKDINMILLSHCHFDHTGGISGVLKEIDKEIPVIAHPAIFRQNFVLGPYLKNIGISSNNSEEVIIRNGGQLVLVKEPVTLMEGVITTGEVEKNSSFEEIGINSYNLEDGKLTYDEIIDDTSIIVNIKDKGLLIITGCGHSGIINIINHAKKITGINNVYGVAGGLHLLHSADTRIDKTLEVFKSENLKLIATGHCTGLKAQYKISNMFSDAFTMLNSGKTIEIK